MQLITILTAAILPLTALASPIADTSLTQDEAQAQRLSIIKTRDDAAEAAGLVKRADKFCDVVNVVTTVDCWLLPKHGGNGNQYIKSFPGTRNNIDFSCWTKCESVGGIT
jgi:hypothetical protein